MDPIFNEIYKNIIEANEPQIGEFKTLVKDKESQSIIDLGIRVLAYDGAFRTQARSDYKERELEGKSISEFLRSEGVMGKNAIRKIEKKVHGYFKSSFRPHQQQYHEQIKQIFIDAELERIKQTDSYYDPHRDEDINEKQRSLFEQFNKEFLPRYKKRRKAFVIKLLYDLNIEREAVNDIQVKASNIIVNLANQRIPTNLKMVRTQCIQYLEDCIEHYLPILLKDLKSDRHVRKLIEIRKKSDSNSFNTICNRCGRPLLKRGQLRFCTKKENRKCYEARRKENRKFPWPKKILMTKNLCQNCGKYSSLSHVHKRKGLIEEQFCSKTCYETFRKRLQRGLKKRCQPEVPTN